LLTIDRNLCTGCGICLDACPNGAISLDEVEYVSTIDAVLCNECLECLDVCPNDAIRRVESSELVSVSEGEIVEGEVIRREMMPVPELGPPAMLQQPGRLVALAGTALSFVGSWLLPRAADALVGAVEHRLTQGENSVPSNISRRSGSQAPTRRMGGGRGGRSRQRRRRRGGR
jgi:NAD-dependent dihydropyrimidine dehydrogenase PreA subunit